MAATDYEGTQKGAFLPREDAGYFNVVATFPSHDAAGQAIESLHDQGFGDADARILGSTDDAVVGGIGLTEHDVKVVGSSVRWAVIGTVAGAAIGAVIGLVIMAIPSFQSAIGIHASAGSYGLAALFGALIGSVLGFAGGILGLDRDRSGVSSYNSQRAGEGAMIGVHAEGEQQTGAATAALHRAGALSIDRSQRNKRVVLPPSAQA